MFIDFQEFTEVVDLLVFIARIDAIVNAANTQVQFGDGISRAISNATGQRNQINHEAIVHINNFNERIRTNNQNNQ